MSDIDRLGEFYLGRHHDLATGETQSEPLLYDSRDLTTHAVCVGMTGSGKTGLCLSLLEEAALDGVPAIAIDPKGDLGNLLLAFPNLAPADFRPWIDPSEAARKQLSPDDFAAAQAELWRNGLANWGEGPERIGRYVSAADRVIYTPGSSAGIPLTVIKSFRAPPPELVADGDALGERIGSAVSGLLALLGIDADPIRSREHIFLSSVLDVAWREGRDLDLMGLIRLIQRPAFERIGAVDLESFFPADDRTQLAMRLNSLLASPAFSSWLAGEPLNIQQMLYTPAGRPRLAIVSIAHLDDAQRMFFVTILLNEVLTWMRSQPGTSSLRAVLYMDEVFGYFPPLANPPSKRPMLTLMKQARAFGLGCVLATQNPVDLDYKGLSNAGTWLLGRLQTERDKARVIEGLEGASVQAGSTFNRASMERSLAALGNRVFLMNNVHENQPVVFHTRWAMSYLRGPLTRDQIKVLMDPRRADFPPTAAGESGASADAAEPVRAAVSAATTRPILPPTIREAFAAIRDRVPDGFRLVYEPGLLGKGKVHFVQASNHVDQWQECSLLRPMSDAPPDDVWEGAVELSDDIAIEAEPDDRGEFAALPSELAREKSYAVFARQLKDHLYRARTLELRECELLDAVSQPGESEGDFRVRLTQLARERRDAERDELENKRTESLAKADADVARKQAKRNTQRWQFFAKLGGILLVILETVARLLGAGRRGRPRSADTAFRQAATERGQQADAEIQLRAAVEKRERLEQEFVTQRDELQAKYAVENLRIESRELKPRKSDIETGVVVLVWLPVRVDATGRSQRVY